MPVLDKREFSFNIYHLHECVSLALGINTIENYKFITILRATNEIKNRRRRRNKKDCVPVFQCFTICDSHFFDSKIKTIKFFNGKKARGNGYSIHIDDVGIVQWFGYAHVLDENGNTLYCYFVFYFRKIKITSRPLV